MREKMRARVSQVEEGHGPLNLKAGLSKTAADDAGLFVENTSARTGLDSYLPKIYFS